MKKRVKFYRLRKEVQKTRQSQKISAGSKTCSTAVKGGGRGSSRKF